MPLLLASFFFTYPFLLSLITSFFEKLFYNFEFFIFLVNWLFSLNLLLVAFIDPGQIRKDKEYEIGKFKDEELSCGICKVLKSDNADHCFTCGTCVIELDHHCPVLGNCIGRNNIAFFRLIPILFFALLVTSLL